MGLCRTQFQNHNTVSLKDFYMNLSLYYLISSAFTILTTTGSDAIISTITLPFSHCSLLSCPDSWNGCLITIGCWIWVWVLFTEEFRLKSEYIRYIYIDIWTTVIMLWAVIIRIVFQWRRRRWRFTMLSLSLTTWPLLSSLVVIVDASCVISNIVVVVSSLLSLASPSALCATYVMNFTFNLYRAVVVDNINFDVKVLIVALAVVILQTLPMRHCLQYSWEPYNTVYVVRSA